MLHAVYLLDIEISGKRIKGFKAVDYRKKGCKETREIPKTL